MRWQPSPREENEMARKRIIIIEDSGLIASIYRAKLQGYGHDIHVGADGEAGLALVNQLDPDLVVLDLGLPKMSGIEVLNHIREQSRFQDLPVLVLSGAYSRAVDEAWAAGATSVLSKAGDTPNRVVEIIRTTLAAS
jgi:CheY-like chemotaxis protein